MKRTLLYTIWGMLFLLCGVLGNFASPTGIVKAALVIISVIFFVPGILLLIEGISKQDKSLLLQIRWISGLSLGLTTAAILANILCVFASETVGNVLYRVLVFVSSPMICSQYWGLSLFLWACLLICTIPKFMPGQSPQGRK